MSSFIRKYKSNSQTFSLDLFFFIYTYNVSVKQTENKKKVS